MLRSAVAISERGTLLRLRSPRRRRVRPRRLGVPRPQRPRLHPAHLHAPDSELRRANPTGDRQRLQSKSPDAGGLGLPSAGQTPTFHDCPGRNRQRTVIVGTIVRGVTSPSLAAASFGSPHRRSLSTPSRSSARSWRASRSWSSPSPRRRSLPVRRPTRSRRSAGSSTSHRPSGSPVFTGRSSRSGFATSSPSARSLGSARTGSSAESRSSRTRPALPTGTYVRSRIRHQVTTNIVSDYSPVGAYRSLHRR